MKKKSVSERVKERLAQLEKVPAHQQGRMRGVLVPGPEDERVDDDEAEGKKPFARDKPDHSV